MALIDRKNKYIYIHPYKTAGNSIRAILPQPHEELMGFHVEALAVRKHFESKGQIKFWNDACKFAVIRNPFDWCYSLYSYIRRAKGHGEHGHMMNKNFYQFLVWLTEDAMKRDRPHGSNKYLDLRGFVCDEDDNIIVDYLIKYENIDRDMETMMIELGFLIKVLPKKNVDGKRDRNYRVYYDERSRAYVEKHFAKDLELFNYEF